MISTKQYNPKQQKIKNLLDQDGEQTSDLTRKELIDAIRRINDEDYELTEKQREKLLYEQEKLRIRKHRMDGKISAEEEKFLLQDSSINNKRNGNRPEEIQERAMTMIFPNTFDPNPIHTARSSSSDRKNKNKKQKPKQKQKQKPKQKQIEDKKEEETEAEAEQKTEEKETKDEEQTGEETETKKEEDEDKPEEAEKPEENPPDETQPEDPEQNNEENTENHDENQEQKNENNDDELEEDDSKCFVREKSEMTIALNDEEDLEKMYELASKMIFLSGNKK